MCPVTVKFTAKILNELVTRASSPCFAPVVWEAGKSSGGGRSVSAGQFLRAEDATSRRVEQWPQFFLRAEDATGPHAGWSRRPRALPCGLVPDAALLVPL